MDSVTLRKEAMTETYEDVELLVYDTAWKFHNKWGGDIDELISEANKLFIEAYDSYNDSKANGFTTWLVHSISGGLGDFIRKEWRRSHPTWNRTSDDIYQSPISKPLCVMELIDGLEKDLCIILQLVMETPTEFIQMTLDDTTTVKQFQISMRGHLRTKLNKMGWNMDKITKSFKKIRQVIK